MSRYIDAEWLLNFFVDIPNNFTLTIGNLRATVNDAPSIDIVRCKECKEYCNWLDGKICMRLGSYHGNTKPNDFCSYGNRSEKPNNCEVENYCDDCLYTDTCDSKEFFYACTSKATRIAKDEPQTDCQDCKYVWWNSEAKRYECQIEKCPYSHKTENSSEKPNNSTISKMEQVEDEPQTEMTTEQIVSEMLSIKKILDDGKMPKQTHDIRTNTHECVKDTHDKTEPNSSEKPNNCDTCRFELYWPEMCEGCCEWDSHYEPKTEPQTERSE